jgi:hypothetical protein
MKSRPSVVESRDLLCGDALDDHAVETILELPGDGRPTVFSYPAGAAIKAG